MKKGERDIFLQLLTQRRGGAEEERHIPLFSLFFLHFSFLCVFASLREII
jgi:hypothetical protein